MRQSRLVEFRTHTGVGLGLAVLVTAVAAIVRWALEPFVHDLLGYATFYLSVAAVAAWAGWRAGVISAVLGAIVGFVFFVYLPGRFHLNPTKSYFQLGMYAFAAAVLTALGDWTFRQRRELVKLALELTAAKVSAEQAKAQAESANKAKDQFLAVLSHELRTPLMPVLTTTSMLERDPRLPAEYRDDIEMMRRNIELEARLIDDLLDVTRIVRGKLDLHRKQVDLCDVINRAVEVCRADIDARRLHFDMDFGSDPSYPIDADAARVQQVFWNLLKNAVKFTPYSGHVGVRCRREDGNVIVEVHDDGVGIEPGILPRLFKPFEQGSVETTRQFGGLGLGLIITKGLVEMHGGTVCAKSDGKDKGATFSVTLPLKLDATAAAIGDAPSPAMGEVKQALRILLVEDHGDTAMVMKRLLKTKGYAVQAAGDVTQALAILGQESFDLLISDLGLPDGSGHDLMRQMRQRGIQIPGIALSGFGQEQDIERSEEAGFALHLTKPTSADQIFEAVGRVMKRTSKVPDL